MGGKKCPQQYVGETEKSLKHRFSEHKGYVTNKMYTKATGLHLNEEGHTVSVMEVTVLEKVFDLNHKFGKQREKIFISKFNTGYKGLNIEFFILSMSSKKGLCEVKLY